MADEEERKGWGGLTGYFFNLLVQASFHDEDLLVEDRLLPEVVHWSASGAAGIDFPLVDLSLLVRLARSSAEHQRVVRYLVAMLALAKVGGWGEKVSGRVWWGGGHVREGGRSPQRSGARLRQPTLNFAIASSMSATLLEDAELVAANHCS